MTEQKWAKISSAISLIKDLHEEQMEVLTEIITILTEEESKNANQTNQVILEGL